MKAATGSGTSGTPRVQNAFLYLALFALAVFVAAAWAAWRYAPLRDPYEPASQRSFGQWLVSPLERNAFMRLPVVGRDLVSVFALRGTQHIWATGDDGLILHSPDGGETWERQDNIDWTPARGAPAAAAAASARPAFSLGLIAAAEAAKRPDSPYEIAEAQRALARLGYYTGPADGLSGARTTDAVRRYQLERKLTVDGEVTAELLDLLRKETGGSSNVTQSDAVQAAPQATPDVVKPATEPDDAATGATEIVPADARLVHAIAFGDAQTGVAVNGAHVLVTADGGRSWRLVDPSPRRLFLLDVAFVTAERGVAVGKAGAIFVTRDGGKTWTSRPFGAYQGAVTDLVSVAFDDGEFGLAVSSNGTVLATSDGGDRWAQVYAVKDSLVEVAFAGAGRFVAIGEDDVWISSDGGSSWSSQPQTDEPVTWVAFEPATGRGISGGLRVTADGGANWASSDTAPSGDYAAGAFLDARHAVIVGLYGQIAVTRDGGSTWSVPARSLEPLAVAFANESDGVAVGQNGVTWFTNDGGEVWSIGATGTSTTLRSVAFAGARAIAVGDLGTVLTSDDRGATWTTRESGSDQALVGVAVDGARAIAVRDDGTVLTSNDAGTSWTIDDANSKGDIREFVSSQLSAGFAETGSPGELEKILAENGALNIANYAALALGPGAVFRDLGSESAIVSWPGDRQSLRRFPAPAGVTSAAFLDSQRIVAVTGDSLQLTKNGGQSWDERLGRKKLGEVTAASKDRAVAVGDNTFFVTQDGGDTWHGIEYSRRPSPLFWLLSGIALLLGVAAAIRAWVSVPTEERPASVADFIASDRPLRSGERDALGLAEIAAGISRFLRNRATEPPLTIAISGEWGSGKSSLMRLLFDDLRSRGFRPVWFNAWHHQRGEQLLASMYANIRAQGLPSWLTPEGWGFRLNLAVSRFASYWLRLSVTLLLVVFVVVYLLNHDGWQAIFKSEGFFELDTKKSLDNVIKIVPALAALIPALVAAYRALRAFGLNPKSLLGTVSTTSDGALTTQPGVRYRFAAEFAEVTAALKPHHLVLFIDDLDRCDKDHVLEVLETVNFLVTAGECYVVLGMSRRWVETCVGLAFKDLAAERPDESREHAGEGGKTDERDERRRFARQYLEKLINIEVPIPQVTDSASAALLVPDKAEPLPWTVRFASGCASVARVALLPSLLVLIVALGVFAGRHLPALWVAEGKDGAAAATAAPNAAVQAAAPAAGGAAPPRQTKAARGAPTGPAYAAGATDSATAAWHAAIASAGIAGLLALILVLVVRRGRAQTSDSKTFTEALRVMRPWIVLGHPTPRLLKRYLNHVRFVAMRQRGEDEPQSLLDRVLTAVARRLGVAPPPVAAPPASSALAEPQLVALSALHQSHPDWQKDPAWLTRSYGALRGANYTDVVEADREDPSGRARIVKALKEAVDTYNASPDFENYRVFKDEHADRVAISRLLELMAGVSLSAGAQPPPDRDAPSLETDKSA